MKAFLSWSFDFFASVTTPFLLYAWITDLQNPKSPSYLSQSFIDNGFCETPLFPVHKYCALFDWICGTIFILLYNNSYGLICYMISHGYGHWTASQTQSQITTPGAIALAGILSIGPINTAKTLIDTGICSPKIAYYSATAMLAATTQIFVTFLKWEHLSLLYINLIITVCISTPRMLFIGFTRKRDIILRENIPFFWCKLLSNTAVLTIMIIEPLACDNFLKQLGGHLLFDISLASQILWEIKSA